MQEVEQLARQNRPGPSPEVRRRRASVATGAMVLATAGTLVGLGVHGGNKAPNPITALEQSINPSNDKLAQPTIKMLEEGYGNPEVGLNASYPEGTELFPAPEDQSEAGGGAGSDVPVVPEGYHLNVAGLVSISNPNQGPNGTQYQPVTLNEANGNNALVWVKYNIENILPSTPYESETHTSSNVTFQGSNMSVSDGTGGLIPLGVGTIVKN